MSRLRTSHPHSSVPARCARLGPSNRTAGSIASGSYGATSAISGFSYHGRALPPYSWSATCPEESRQELLVRPRDVFAHCCFSASGVAVEECLNNRFVGEEIVPPNSVGLEVRVPHPQIERLNVVHVFGKQRVLRKIRHRPMKDLVGTQELGGVGPCAAVAKFGSQCTQCLVVRLRHALGGERCRRGLERQADLEELADLRQAELRHDNRPTRVDPKHAIVREALQGVTEWCSPDPELLLQFGFMDR